MNDWQSFLAGEKDLPYFKELFSFVEHERTNGKRIYPNESQVFIALQQTQFEDVKVVILGQDPYHGEGQAHGLAFSVPDGVRIPPSLRNIYKELENDLKITPPKTGNLSPWAKQGVLLLNSILTVEESKPGSHANKGWEQFTDKLILELIDKSKNIVFLLWGSYAQKKMPVKDSNSHLFLHAAHPSPFSAYRGFLGCRHFSQANEYLIKVGRSPIDWGKLG
jgi:uracil-DNA glycosylase